MILPAKRTKYQHDLSDLAANDPEAIIFDCDGVLLDSFASNRAYYDAVLKGLGLPPMSGEQAAYVHASTVDGALAYLVPPERRPDLPAVMSAIDYNRDFIPLLEPAAGIHALLELLRDHDIFLGILTNRSESMFEILRLFDFGPFFPEGAVITADMVRPKPSPEGFQLLAQRFKLKKNRLAYIGDSRVDQEAAEAAGVRFWACANAGLTARLHINNFVDLAEDFSAFWACQQRKNLEI